MGDLVSGVGRECVVNERSNVNVNESYLVKGGLRERMSESVISCQTECTWSRNFVTVTPAPGQTRKLKQSRIIKREKQRMRNS
jgi:hypothetical protein